MSKELSRRDFLKGTVVGAIGLGTVGILGACQNNEKRESDQTNDDKNKIVWSNAADLIVVGGGGAGFCAAIEAAKSGSSVIILEKNDICGGDTLLSGGMIMVGGSELQKSLGMNDSIENFTKTELRYISEYANPEMVREMCEASVEELQFMMDLGREYSAVMPMKPVWGYDIEEEWAPRTHWQGMNGTTGHFAALETAVKELGNVEVKTGKEVVRLVTNDKKEVIGVETKDGHLYRANKGVLLATASFGRNKEMSKQYNPMNYWALGYEEAFNKPSPNAQSMGNTGDGIRMAQEIGADLVLTQANCISDCCAVSFDSQYGSILVNNQGQRFVQENAHWGYLNQMVFNEAVHQNALDSSKVHFWIIADQYAVDNNLYLNAISNGIVRTATENYFPLIKKADTLSELATQTGLPVEKLEETVDRWNSMVDAGEDIDFNRRDINGTHDLVKMESAPYYAFPYIPYSMGSFGGLKTDGETQVINTSGTVIPRLYAAGSIMSGMITAPFYNACGWAILGTVHWGRKAGRNIAALEPWTTEEIVPAEESEDNNSAIQDAITTANGNYNAGVYSSTVQGRNGEVTVSVEFSDKAIIEITIDEHKETVGLGTNAIELIRERVLLTQNADVDIVSGATVTSDAMLAAIRECISQASK